MHGGDIYRNEVRLDFSVNVNPLGPPGCVMAALSESLAQISCYPDPQCLALRLKLAGRYGVRPEQIIAGNGASELIFALVRAVRPKTALLTAPGFSEYERALRGEKSDILFVPPGADLAGIIGDRKPGLVLVANPNNPTGQMIPLSALMEAAAACAGYGGVFAVDECFLELSDQGESASLIPHLDLFDAAAGNAVVLRAFTKTYSIPGIRIGYMLLPSGGAPLADKIREQLPDWNCSGPAQAAGEACLDTGPDYLQKARDAICAEREYLSQELSGLGIRVFPSQTNYLLLYRRERPGESLYKELLERKILIRDCSDYRALGKGYYRIAVRRHEENVQLLRAIQDVAG